MIPIDMNDRQLSELIGKYLAGTATPTEENLLLDWYNSVDHREIIIPFESEAEKELLMQRMRSGIRQRTAGFTPVIAAGHTLAFKRSVRYASAAILAFLACSIYLLNHRPLSRPKAAAAAVVPCRQDVAPGHNGAVLTLGNGRQIQLDSTGSGNIAIQGATRLVKQNGELAYEAGNADLVSQTAGRVTADPASSSAIVYNTMTTPRGRQFKVILPDGTGVWLNAASSITYPTAFRGGSREVSITGEAYFEVTHIENQPFRVKAGNVLIEDLGTHFNVNAYPDEPALKTTLLEGAVRVSKGRNVRQLSPGQQAQMENDGDFRIIPDADIDQTMAWKNGLFQYSSTNLETIMRQIARWYDVQIIYQGAIKDEAFSGTVPQTENVSQVLNMLAMTNTIHFTIENNKIYVRP
jgi:transmembrane sensor